MTKNSQIIDNDRENNLKMYWNNLQDQTKTKYSCVIFYFLSLVSSGTETVIHFAV